MGILVAADGSPLERVLAGCNGENKVGYGHIVIRSRAGLQLMGRQYSRRISALDSSRFAVSLRSAAVALSSQTDSLPATQESGTDTEAKIGIQVTAGYAQPESWGRHPGFLVDQGLIPTQPWEGSAGSCTGQLLMGHK